MLPPRKAIRDTGSGVTIILQPTTTRYLFSDVQVAGPYRAKMTQVSLDEFQVWVQWPPELPADELQPVSAYGYRHNADTDVAEDAELAADYIILPAIAP
jgi:hypothetical protein